ncbi:hypothetical protein LEMLEM_LOCUS18690, partial [Lemmus lemmus]
VGLCLAFYCFCPGPLQWEGLVREVGPSHQPEPTLCLSLLSPLASHPSALLLYLLLPLGLEPLQVINQVVTLHVDSGALVGEHLHLAPQLTHLLLVELGDASRLAALEPIDLGGERGVLLLQEAHFLDVVGEAVIELLQLHLLVGACGQELLVHRVGQREVQQLASAVGWRAGGPQPAGPQRPQAPGPPRRARHLVHAGCH